MCTDEAALEQLDIALGMREDPDAEALDELRRHQEVSGMTFEDPDAPVAAQPDDGLEPWMTADEEFR